MFALSAYHLHHNYLISVFKLTFGDCISWLVGSEHLKQCNRGVLITGSSGNSLNSLLKTLKYSTNKQRRESLWNRGFNRPVRCFLRRPYYLVLYLNNYMYITIGKFTCVPPEIPCTPAMLSSCGVRNANRVSSCLSFRKTYGEGFIPWLGDKISGGFCIWLGDYLILSISPIVKGNFYVPIWLCWPMKVPRNGEIRGWKLGIP